MRLDVGDDLVAQPNLVQTALGGEDQLGPPIFGIGAPFDIAELLELVGQPPDDLLVPAREARQLGRPDPIFIQVGEHGSMARMEIVVAGGRELRKELLL